MTGFTECYRDDVIDRDNESEQKKQENEARYRYLHLAPEEQTAVDLVLKGHMDMTYLPKLDSRVVRIFVSSTFTGTVAFIPPASNVFALRASLLMGAPTFKILSLLLFESG